MAQETCKYAKQYANAVYERAKRANRARAAAQTPQEILDAVMITAVTPERARKWLDGMIFTIENGDAPDYHNVKLEGYKQALALID